MSKCIECGNELDTGGDNLRCSQCRWKHQNLAGITGWVCPVCGRGNSPYTSTCLCQPLPNKITC